MRNHFQSEVVLILFVCSCALALGLMMGFPLTGLICGLVGYVCWILYQISELSSWLKDPESRDAPHLHGIFELVLDRSLRVKRQHERERQRLKANLNRQTRLISGVRDAVVLVDSKNRINWLNKQASEILSIHNEKDVGLPLGNLIRNPRFLAYLEADRFEEPIKIPAPGTRLTWLEVSVTEYRTGDKIMVLRDITRMQKLEEMRTDFIANLSHELRTPLTVLRGYIETLMLQTDLTESSKRIYSEMSNQSDRMAQLLKDLMTLSRLESGESSRTREPVKLGTMLRLICKDAQSLKGFADHSIEEDLQQGLCINAVENELYSAFSNLIYNAVRHTPAGTKIQVRAYVDDLGVIVEVSDDGPGIEAKHLSRLTERFYRVDASRNSGSGGTGLGLAIVKHAINAQGGDLSINSHPGKGSRFRCRFPLQQVCNLDVNKKSEQKAISQ